MGGGVAPPSNPLPLLWKSQNQTTPTALRFHIVSFRFRIPLPLPTSSSSLSSSILSTNSNSHSISLCHHVMSSRHVIVSLVMSISHVVLSCHTVIHIITILIRIQLDNIYVNKLTMKQLITYTAIHICKLVHSCKQLSGGQYLLTTNIN